MEKKLNVPKKENIAERQRKYDEKLVPIYENREAFERALDIAWKEYDNGYRIVDAFEDNFTECAFAKGFRDGFLLAVKLKSGETK